MNTQPEYAIVEDIDPLRCDLEGSTITLDADDLVLSQHVRWYDATYGIKPKDSLVVIEMANGDFLVQDVVSDTDVS